MSRVKTIVVDPGTAPPHYQHVCHWPDPDHHGWQITSLDRTRSTWVCMKCRRIEKRRVVGRDV